MKIDMQTQSLAAFYRWPMLVLMLALSACGQREIRDLPPVVALSQLQLDAQQALVQIRIENPNTVPLRAVAMEFELVLGAETLRYNGATQADIDPNSAEEVAVRLPVSAGIIEGLRALQTRDSVSWELRGELPQLEERDWPFRSRGVLFPVPGVPDLYRASAIGSAYPLRR